MSREVEVVLSVARPVMRRHVGGRSAALFALAGAYDAIQSLTAAFGMRRLRTAYTGSILRLRESGGNTEQDIGAFISGAVDTAAATTFIGANSGFFVKRYDQSGNANDATQSTASLQPQYVNDSDGVRPYHDRSNDLLAIASLAAGTYTVGISTWSCAQVFVHKQNATGSYSLNPADAFDYVIIDNPSLDAGELASLQTALQSARPAVNSADVLRLWSSSTSVSLSFTESADAGATWEAGDGQTGSGTSFVKTLAAAPDWVILRAEDKTKITVINWNTKNLFGQLGDLSALTALTTLYCYSNQLTGSIPSLTANTALTQLYCYSNQLTGSIPSLATNTALTLFRCFSNQLTGSIPSLTANTALTDFRCYSNQLTGSIPSLATNTALTLFYCYTNKLTNYTGGGVSITLGSFDAQNNLLTQAAVDAILADFVAANKTTGTRVLNLGGTGNATPSAAGLTDKTTLEGRGWTVTTN